MFSNDSLKKCIKKRSRKQIEGAPLIYFRLFISLSVVPGVIFTNPGVGTVGLTIEDLTDTMAPYLTMVEGLKLTALGYNNDNSKLSCCAE